MGIAALDPSPRRAAPTGEGSGGTASPPLIPIGHLAREFGITVRSLRFYESLGLLSPRRDGPARFYSPADQDRLALILQGKKLGFTLREIGQLLDGQPASLKLSRAQCVEQINLLERQKHAIEQALAELRRTYSSFYTRALALEQATGGEEDAA
jgi:DNA-binding transcriptional MerR regulator